MIDTLTHLLESYLAWRAAPVEVYMGISPAAIGAIVAVGSTVLGSILNKPSGAEEAALRAGTEAGGAQAAELSRQTAARDFLEKLLRGQLGGDSQIDPNALFQFPESAGGPSFSIDQLMAQATAANKGAMLDRLLALAGAGGGAGAASTALTAGLGAESRERQGTTDLLQRLAFLFANSQSTQANQAASTSPLGSGNPVIFDPSGGFPIGSGV